MERKRGLGPLIEGTSSFPLKVRLTGREARSLLTLRAFAITLIILLMVGALALHLARRAMSTSILRTLLLVTSEGDSRSASVDWYRRLITKVF